MMLVQVTHLKQLTAKWNTELVGNLLSFPITQNGSMSPVLRSKSLRLLFLLS